MTAANLADTFAGCFEDGVYVSVNGGELKKVSAETKVSELADGAADAKGFFIGYEYYGSEAAEKMCIRDRSCRYSRRIQ